jgi:hypothetical protein
MWRAEGRSLYVLVFDRYGHGSTSSGGDHPRDLHRVVSHITIICRPYNDIGWVATLGVSPIGHQMVRSLPNSPQCKLQDDT